MAVSMSRKFMSCREMGRAAKGKSIANFLQLRPDEKVAALLRIKEFSDKTFFSCHTGRHRQEDSPQRITRTVRKGASSASPSKKATVSSESG